MLEISVAIVIVAAIAAWLVNKHMDHLHTVNTKSAEAELSAAIDTLNKQFDDRINNTWGTVSAVKQELEALKLAIGLKGNR